MSEIANQPVPAPAEPQKKPGAAEAAEGDRRPDGPGAHALRRLGKERPLLGFLIQTARFAAAVSVFSSRQAIVIGPTPPGTGVIAPATPAHSAKGDVAHQPAVRQPVDADIDHRRAGGDPVAADHLRPPDRGDQDLGAAALGGEIGACGNARW